MQEYMTFHKILDLIENYQQQSPILNTFGYGNLVDFQKNTSGYTVEYPYIFVTPQTITYDENTTTYSLSIIFGDRVNTDLSNEKDVVSDMSIEAKRFLSYIKRGDLFPYFEVTLPNNGVPFFERFNDHVGGVALLVDLIVLEDINACDYYEPVVSPTPSMTPTPTLTPQLTTQYLEVELQESTKFKLVLWNDPLFTSPAVALCDYYVTGTAYGDLGTIFNGIEVINEGQHQHQFDLAPILQPGEIVTGFTVSNVSTSACTVPVNVVFTPYQTPTPTPTATNTATPTVTPTMTPTPSATPPVCYEVGAGFSNVPTAVATISGSTYYYGSNTNYSGVTTYNLIKLNEDMSRDTVWNSGNITIGPLAAGNIFLDNNNKLIVVGGYTTIQGVTRARMARLEGDTGLLDTSFDFGGGAGFGNNSVLAVYPTSDGGYICGGSFTTINGVTRNRIVKLTSTGVIDAGFDVGTGFNTGQVNWIKETSTGQFLVSGSFGTYNGSSVSRICRLNSDGSLDAGFQPVLPGSPTNVYRFTILPDNTIVALTDVSPRLARIDTDGAIDGTFNTNLGTGPSITSTASSDIVTLPNGKVLVGSVGLSFNGSIAGSVVVLNTDGTRDTSVFTGTNFGNVISNNFRIMIRPNNTIVFTGNFLNYNLALENRVVVTDLSGNELMC